MLVDARRLPDHSLIEADVCIVGAGPAGLTLARELARRSVRVCLVESGGTRPDGATQALADIAPAGGEMTFPPRTRRRQLGGTATVWDVAVPGRREGVLMRPFDAIDFEQRDYVPDSGWPFGREELDPYYERAQAVLGLRTHADSAEDWADSGLAPWPLDPARVRTVVDQFARRDAVIGDHIRTLRESPDVQVLLWANALGLEAPSETSVDCLHVGCLDGARHRVRASLYVLACGGVENARLLLLSEGALGDGIGNRSGLVGRFFMDHAWADLGTFVPDDPACFDRSGLYDIRPAGVSFITGRLQLAEDIRREEQLLNAAVAATPAPTARRHETVEALRYLRSGGRRGAAPSRLAAISTVARRLPYVAALTTELAWRQRRFPPTVAYGWSELPRPARHFAGFALELQLELGPRPENAVVLSDQRDALGQPLAGVRYDYGPLERRTLARTGELVAGALHDSGLGRVEPPEAGAAVLDTDSIHHHMGTTRMHESPRRGVVDPQGQVHGVANLYVAGSSVFPTGGFANPTLTILALTLRLADHLALE